jgi:hypothetical protein
MDHSGGKLDGLLNASQKNYILTTLRQADHLLCDCEQILASGASHSAFGSYLPDFTEEDQTALYGFISRLRASFSATLSRLGMAVPAPRISALRAIQTNLDYIDMDLEELRPRSMTGYGPLAEEASEGLETAVQNLQAELRAMLGYLRARDREP